MFPVELPAEFEETELYLNLFRPSRERLEEYLQHSEESVRVCAGYFLGKLVHEPVRKWSSGLGSCFVPSSCFAPPASIHIPFNLLSV